MFWQTGSPCLFRELIVGLILCGIPATAQGPAAPAKAGKAEAKPEAKPAEAKEAPPETVSGIPERMQKTAGLVRTAQADAAPQDRIREIDRTLPEYANGVRALLATSRRFLKTEKSPGLIRELRGAWSISRRRLDGWQSTLKKRSASLQQDFQSLQQQKDDWEAIVAGASDLKLPPAMLAEIKDLQKSILQAQNSVLAARNDSLKLQGTISSLGIEMDTMDGELNAAAGDERWSLFRRDGPPIWRPDQAVTEHKEAVRTRAEATQTMGELVEYYVRSVSAVVLAQAGWFLVILITLLVVRRRIERWLHDEDECVRTLALVVGRPFSLALLLSLLGGSLWYSKAPHFLVEGVWLMLLIPLLRIMPLVLSPDIKPALWILAALYFMDGLLGLLPTYATSTRVLVLVMLSVAAGGLLWIDRRLRTKLAPSGGRNLSLICIRIGFALLVVAFAGEVAGATALSRFLEGAVLKSVYAAVILYGSFPVVLGILHLAMRRRPQALQRATLLAESRLSRGLQWLGMILFAYIVLRAHELDEPVTQGLKDALNYKFSVGAIEFTTGSILTFALVLIVASLFSRTIRFFLAARLYRSSTIGRGAGEAVSKLLHYAVLTAGFVLALGAAGIDLNKFTILAGGLGVGVGFGMQNIINNFVSGLILLFERPLQVGDVVTVGTTAGEVKDIGIRASTIRTWEGADVVIPNASLISGDFTNWSLSDKHRRGELIVGVALGSDPERVIRILKETASVHPKVLRYPDPVALFDGFGESSLRFILRYWTLLDDYGDVRSDIHAGVCRRLSEEGIRIPVPQRDLNVRNVDVKFPTSDQQPAPSPRESAATPELRSRE